MAMQGSLTTLFIIRQLPDFQIFLFLDLDTAYIQLFWDGGLSSGGSGGGGSGSGGGVGAGGC